MFRLIICIKGENTMAKCVYEKTYSLLLKLIPQLWEFELGEAANSKVENYMDLNLDVLDKTEQSITIALSHYYKHPSGDLIPDPDMQIRVYKHEMAEALTYQDSYFFQRVYIDENRYYPKLKKQLNSFLRQWLKNCIDQEHQLKREPYEA